MMVVSNCCGASIILTDLCSQCKEHCDAECEEHEPYYQPEEKDTNVPEQYYCEVCLKDLPMPEPDWDAMVKESNL
tara:strand:- start:103 stop:327 length:225 start_codon:yes stop_codon:yes gene_type:complete